MTTETVSEIKEVPPAPEEPLTEVMAQEAYFLEDCVKVVLSGGVEKLVTYDTFINIIKRVTNTLEDSALEGFCLPSNVFYFAKSGDSINLSCYYASKVCNLKYGRSAFDILMPNLIVSHILTKGSKAKEWRISSSRYFCTDLNVGNLPKTFINSVNSNARVWLMPMSNTYPEGNMCYGGNSMPLSFADNNLRGLDWYYQFLWESPFNDDLGIRATGMYPSDWYTLLKKCADEKLEFPYNKITGFRPR